jgi:hypothetical protein
MSARSDAAVDRSSYSATAPPDSSTGLTVTMWAYLSVDQAANETLFRLHSSSGSTTRINFATNSGGTTPCIFTSGNTGGVSSGTALGTATWCRCAFTTTGTSGTAYAATGSGGSTTSATGTASGGATADAFTIFGRSSGDASEWFNGRISHLRVWSAVLTQTQIETEWLSTTPVRATNLWGAWPLISDLVDTVSGKTLVPSTGPVTFEAEPPIPATSTATRGAFFAFF